MPRTKRKSQLKHKQQNSCRALENQDSFPAPSHLVFSLPTNTGAHAAFSKHYLGSSWVTEVHTGVRLPKNQGIHHLHMGFTWQAHRLHVGLLPPPVWLYTVTPVSCSPSLSGTLSPRFLLPRLHCGKELPDPHSQAVEMGTAPQSS